MKASSSPLGAELGDMIKQGKIIPQAKYSALVQNAMAGGGLFLIDGFPKSSDSLKAFDAAVQLERKLALHFVLGEGELISRIAGNDSSLADADAQKRAQAYKRQTQELLDVLKAQGILHEIDGADDARGAAKATELVKGTISGSQDAAPTDMPTGGRPPSGVPMNKVVFVLGHPGSGKGTQCAKLVDKYGCLHLSTGDLLRAEVAACSEQGVAIAETIKEGKIVTAQTNINLLKAAMAKADPATPILIDGFPQSRDNLAIFEEQVGACALCLFLDGADHQETLEARLLERGKTSGRTDDNIDSIRKRFATFETRDTRVIDELNAKLLVVQIDASPSVEDVFAAVCEKFDQI